MSCGAGLNLSILRFCKDALVRRFGQGWYDAACEAEAQWNEAKRNGNGG